jgi:recombinational DNA repair ATPase RecF
MSIKTLRIENFLSYKAAKSDLSSGLNVFVGRNGSGKSNLINGNLNVILKESLDVCAY